MKSIYEDKIKLRKDGKLDRRTHRRDKAEATYEEAIRNNPKQYLPSPEQIKIATAKIRANWTPLEESQRRMYKTHQWHPSTFHLTEIYLPPQE